MPPSTTCATAGSWTATSSPSRAKTLRGDIELCTDLQERSIVKTLADDFEELCMILTPMKDKLVAGGGIPGRPDAMTRP